MPERIPDSDHLAQMKVFLINAQNQSHEESNGEATSFAEVAKHRKAQLVQAQREKDKEGLKDASSSESSDAESVQSLPKHQP